MQIKRCPKFRKSTLEEFTIRVYKFSVILRMVIFAESNWLKRIMGNWYINHFISIFHLHKPRKSQKTRGFLTSLEGYRMETPVTAQKKMKFSIKNFFSKCDQTRSFLRSWSHLLKKSFMENSIFCATSNKWVNLWHKIVSTKIIDQNVIGFSSSFKDVYLVSLWLTLNISGT